MSHPETQQARLTLESFARLEGAVNRLIRQSAGLRAELRGQKARIRELMDLLGPVAEGRADPESLIERIRAGEAEREQLKERLAKGRKIVDRMMARIRFLEEHESVE